MKISDILNQAAGKLVKADLPSPRLDAEVLLFSCLQIDRVELYKNPERVLDDGEIALYNERLDRRSLGEPVSYITGEKEFWSLLFEVTGHVLIPRPETEILVEEAIRTARDLSQAGLRILEIGVGSGAVSVAVAHELPDARVVATDISPQALTLAGKNARFHGVADRVDFRQGSLFNPIAGVFDMILSNPPYIPVGEFDRLPRDVRDFEPRQALLAGNDGLFFYERIIAGSPGYLKKGGWLLMEMGEGQKDPLEEMLRISGAFDMVSTRRDYAGIERVVRARRR